MPVPEAPTKPAPVPLQGVQEVGIKPLVVRVPETTRIIERTFVERERRTEPLPVTPAPPVAVPHITVNVERSKDENNQSVPGETTPNYDTPRVEKERGSTSTPEVSPVVESVPEVRPPAQEQKTLAPEEPARTPKNLTPDNKKINEPINFSPSEPAPQASSRPKMKHVARTRGRQRKYHQTIALLEDYHDGETDQFARLDEQMQRYYRREYPEYFGRDSKTKANQRLSNRTKAARTKRESERRRITEISRSIQGIPDNRPEVLDAD